MLVQFNMAKRPRRGRGPAEKVWKHIYLKQWRDITGLTQQELADRSGVSYSQISLIETGASAGSPDSLLALAEALMIELGDLFTHPEKGKRLLKIWVEEDEQARVQAVIAAVLGKRKL